MGQDKGGGAFLLQDNDDLRVCSLHPDGSHSSPHGPYLQLIGSFSYIWLGRVVRKNGHEFSISRFILPDCQVDDLGSRLFERPKEC